MHDMKHDTRKGPAARQVRIACHSLQFRKRRPCFLAKNYEPIERSLLMSPTTMGDKVAFNHLAPQRPGQLPVLGCNLVDRVSPISTAQPPKHERQPVRPDMTNCCFCLLLLQVSREDTKPVLG